MAGGAATWRLVVRRMGHSALREAVIAEAGQLQPRMYGKGHPEGPEEGLPQHREEEKRPKKGEEPEKKSNLQITDEGVVAVQQFNLEIADKEFIVLVGPSGCGKSTTLRMIAGLEEISGGELFIDGKQMNDVAPKDRDIAMVFQNYALYPHMTVYENIAFPLKLKKIAETDCVGCGQCRVVCPTGAISIKTNIDVVWDALADKDTIVIAQIAPAVRVAAGEEFGIPKGENVMGKLVGVLHRLGFDEVYDTAYGADLTVMEESKEFMERFNAGENLPLFTSCCPAWVKFCENRYPEFVPHLSSCRSPQQMFGAVVREYYKNPENNAGKKLVSVSIMPCTAKKEEILRPESKTNGRQDIDYVLTTTELISMIKRAGIMFDQVEIESADVPFGIGSGAGVIFGVTGGVTEAVLRKITQGHKRADMEELKSSGVRGDDGIKEIVYDYNGKEIKAAIVSGLANADQLLKKIKSGEIHYDFVEVMACRRGCVMGGGQPLDAGAHTREARMQGLYKADVNTQIKKSDENPMVQSLYEGLLKGKTHELLHRNFTEAEKEKNK